PNGETKLRALSIPRLIDTALLILLWRPRGATAQAGPILFRKRNSRDILPRRSVNLRHMTFVSGKGMSELLSNSQTPLFANDAPFVDALIKSGGHPMELSPRCQTQGA